MAHYRQVLDSDFEKLSALKTDEKSTHCVEKIVKDSANEHAILGLHESEAEKTAIDVTVRQSTSCNKGQPETKPPKLPTLSSMRVIGPP